jgi:hypothetical protein
MNAMAQIATTQRAPEVIVVRDDGRPVESVSAGTRGMTIVKIIIPVVVGLAVGIGMGRISKSANDYNEGITGAKGLIGDDSSASSVTQLKRTLSKLGDTLEDARRNGFKVDAALTKKLDGFAKQLEIKPAVYSLTRNLSNDGELAGQVIGFYAGVTEVKSLLDGHLRSAKQDEAALAAAKAAGDQANDAADIMKVLLGSKFRYAVVLSAPCTTEGCTAADRNAQFGAKLVELGPPYCGGKLSTTGKCGENEVPSVIAYRTEPSATGWSQAEPVKDGADQLPTKKILPLIPNSVLDGLVKGQEGGTSEFYYNKRLRALYELVHGKPPDGKGLVDLGNRLEDRLNAEANKGTRFSFFL